MPAAAINPDPGDDDSEMPLAYRRVLELADADLRIYQDESLSFGADEAPRDVLGILRNLPMYRHPLPNHRRVVLNPTDSEYCHQWRAGGSQHSIVLSPGECKVTYRDRLDAVLRPEHALGVLSSVEAVRHAIEQQLDQYGYEYVQPMSER